MLYYLVAFIKKINWLSLHQMFFWEIYVSTTDVFLRNYEFAEQLSAQKRSTDALTATK